MRIPKVTKKNYVGLLDDLSDSISDQLEQMADAIQKSLVNPFLNERGYELKVGNGTWLLSRKPKPDETPDFSDGTVAVNVDDPEEFPREIREVFEKKMPFSDCVGIWFKDYDGINGWGD